MGCRATGGERHLALEDDPLRDGAFYDGGRPTTREVFETYVERVLAPVLKPGQVMVINNLFSHKSSRVKEFMEERGCELLYLPPYPLDLNPIEGAFSKVKRILRRAEARSRGLS